MKCRKTFVRCKVDNWCVCKSKAPRNCLSTLYAINLGYTRRFFAIGRRQRHETWNMKWSFTAIIQMKLQQLSGRICVESLSSLCSIREVIYQVTIINGTLMDDAGPWAILLQYYSRVHQCNYLKLNGGRRSLLQWSKRNRQAWHLQGKQKTVGNKIG